MNQIKSKPKVSKDEIQQIENYQSGVRQKMQVASNQLWLRHQSWVGRLVGAAAKKRRGADLSEMTSEACIAFLKAIESFDLNRVEECSLRTHASYWIWGALNTYARNSMHHGYVVPRCLAVVRKRIFEYSNNRNSIASEDVKKLSKDFDIPVKRIKELEQFFCASKHVNWEEWEVSSIEAFDQNFCSHDQSKMNTAVDRLLESLDKPGQILLKKRWFEKKPLSYRALESELGCTSYKIRQLESKILSGLMREMQTISLHR